MMPAPQQGEYRFWLIVAGVLLVLVWLLGDILAPFFVAMLLAYLLNPTVGRLNEMGVPRGISAGMALLLFLALAVLLVMVTGPIVRAQVFDLVHALPLYIDQLQNEVWPRLSAFVKNVPALSKFNFEIANLTHYTGDVVNIAGAMLGRVVMGGWAFLHLIVFFILTPVITFYLLRDWPIIVSRVDALLPQRHAPAIRQEMKAVDEMVAGFVRGQATVSLCLAAFYSTLLYLTGLKYGLTVGLLTGFLSFIPVIGTVIGVVTSLTLAFIQFSDPAPIAMVAGVFLLAQALDGYFLTPNLVGTRVGLHPVAIIFAILTGGFLFGFIGVILAVPVAGTIAILLRAGVRQYRASRYYLPS
jgi:predicted PurR-regulated permease PerM